MGEQSTITGMGDDDDVVVVLRGVVRLAARKASHSLVERLGASTTRSTPPTNEGTSCATRASVMEEILEILVE